MTPEEYKQQCDHRLKTDWPQLYENIWKECGAGWYNILDNVGYSIKSILTRNDLPFDDNIPFKFIQIKEKFGTLRLYYRHDIEDENIVNQIDAVLTFAEDMSSSICEVCGDRGTRTGGGWIATLCNKHKQDRHTNIEEL